MTVEPATACERFRADCAPVWEALHRHPFIRELAAGTLPPEKFRFYIEQNLMYLPEYAKAMAIGVAKAGDVATMRYFADALTNVVENEIPENRELLERVVALGAADRGGSAVMAPANIAYTSFLVGTALQHGALEIMAAIVPCTWSYGDIASGLGEVTDHPVYAKWVRFFGSPEYGEVIAEMRARFDEMAAGRDEATLARLSYLFTTSTRLERAFWDMAYGLEQWPDLASSPAEMSHGSRPRRPWRAEAEQGPEDRTRSGASCTRQAQLRSLESKGCIELLGFSIVLRESCD